MVNPIHLRTLLEVVRLGSFAGAANRLGYTPSAVSQQMSALEQESGVRLFERSARSVRLTEAATVMARHAITVLAGIDRLLEAAGNAGEGSGQDLRVSIYPSLARLFLPRLLSSPEWEATGLQLRLSVADPSPTIQAMRAGEEIDVALVYRVGESGLSWPQSVSVHRLGDDRMRFVVPVSWGLHGMGPVSPKELVGLPWVFHHPGSSDAAMIDDLFRAHDLRPRTVARSDDFAVTLDLVAAGFAASFVPEIVLHELPAGVVVLNVPEIELSRGVFALASRGSDPQRNELFLGFLSQILTELGYQTGDDEAAPWIADPAELTDQPAD